MLEAEGGVDSLTDRNARRPKGNSGVVLSGGGGGGGAFSIYCDSSWSLNWLLSFQ